MVTQSWQGVQPSGRAACPEGAGRLPSHRPLTMRLSSPLALVTSLALAPVVLGVRPSSTPEPITAQEIVQRYIAARGGLDKLRAIRTLVLRGPPRPNGKPGRQ